MRLKGSDRACPEVAEHPLRWIKEQQVMVENGRVTEYHVNLLVTFVLE